MLEDAQPSVPRTPVRRIPLLLEETSSTSTSLTYSHSKLLCRSYQSFNAIAKKKKKD
jgi:hypothetical protein